MDSSRQYFAALPQYSVELAAALMDRVDRFYAWLPGTLIYRRMRRSWQAYYGLPGEISPFDVSIVGVAGEQGELTQVHVNHLYALAQRLLTMTLGQKPGWQPVTSNADHQSQAQAVLAQAVLDFELRDKRLDRLLWRVAETSLVYSRGWFLPCWDARGGKKYAVDPTTQSPVYEGRLRVPSFTPLETIIDVRRKDSDHDWVILKEYWNKFDLAARFPDFTDDILKLEPDHREIQEWRRTSSRAILDTEQVPLYRFLHRPTDSMPNGREVWFIDAQHILLDGPSVYGDKLGAKQMAPSDIIGTAWGFSPLCNILALQELYNMLISSAATNNANNGIANIAIASGSDISPQVLAGGQNVFEVKTDGGPLSNFISPINLTHTAPETFKMAEMIKESMLELIGQNDVSMGGIDTKLSGAAMALLDAKALQFASLFQASYTQALEDLGTSIVSLYQQFAKAPRELEVIVGKDRRYLLPEFTGEKISSVKRVVVETKNPLTESTSGRMDLVDKLISSGALAGPSSARDIIQVMETGNLQPVLEGPEREDLLIKAENELLAQGQIPSAVMSDNHIRHIQKHDIVIGTPEARMDQKVLAAVIQHNQQHLDLWRNTDPAILAALGIPPPPPPAPPPGMLPPPSGPPGPPGPPPPGAGGPPGPPPSHVEPPPGPTPPNVKPPNMPKPPVNPATGQPYMPPNAGK